MSESVPATAQPESSIPVIAKVRKARSKPVDPAPYLTRTERIVYDRCLQTGDTVKDAVEYDGDLLGQLVEIVLEEIRQDRIQDKLERENVYLKAQMAKLKAGVREKKDEPELAPEDRTDYSEDYPRPVTE